MALLQVNCHCRIVTDFVLLIYLAVKFSRQPVAINLLFDVFLFFFTTSETNLKSLIKYLIYTRIENFDIYGYGKNTEY